MDLGQCECAAGLIGGKIIVVVGTNGGGNCLKECKAYDHTTCQWLSIQSIQTRHAACAVWGVGRILYVMGGQNQDVNKLFSMESLTLFIKEKTRNTWV
eukprot:948413-Ditylum_brightwellii.AAC.1